MRLTVATAVACVCATFAAAESAHAIMQRYELNIPEQRLDTALTDLAQQTGLLIARFSDTIDGGGMVGPISGTQTVADALETLLAGTGLTFKVVSDRTIAVVDPKEMPPAAASQSQTSTHQDVMDTEEIIVEARRKAYITNETTATKSGASLVETAQAITVVNRDQMDAQNAQNIAEALRYTAGVVAEARGTNSRFDSVFLRGFGGSGRTAVYVQNLDGLRMMRGISYAIPQVEQYGLERIDILKGPSSVLYGQASPGGLVNLTSKKPTVAPFKEIEVEGGNYNRRKVGVGFSGPLDDDNRFLYRVTGLWLDTETQVNFSKQERMFVAPALTWNIGDDTSLTLLASYQDDPENGAYGSVPALGTIQHGPYGRISTRFTDGEPGFDQFEREAWTAGYMFSHRVNDSLVFKQNLRYMGLKTDARLVSSEGLRADARTLTRGITTSVEHLDAFTLDNQAQLRFLTGPLQHTLLAGLDYQHGESDRLLGYGAGPTLDILAPVYGQPIVAPPIIGDSTQTQTQLGFYAQDQIELGNWDLQVGLRFDSARSKLLNELNNRVTRQSDDAITGRVGLLYLFDSGVAPYLSYSTSFEPAPGVNAFGRAFEPTEGMQYEAGVKYEPRAFPALITLSVFELTQQNVLTPDTTPGQAGNSVQTGEVRSRGIELEGHARFADRLNLVASYALLDTKVTEANDATLGKWPLGVPRQMASVWTDYDVGAGLGLGIGIRYTSDAYGDRLNTFRVPSYTLFDAVIHYDIGDDSANAGGWRLALNASNLADKEYISTCSTNYSCYYGVRRTVTASARYRF